MILSARPFGEQSAIVHLLSRDHGHYAAMAKGALSRARRGTYQAGNIVEAKWQARLAEHMGMLGCELLVPIAAPVMQDSAALLALQSACTLTALALAEREPHRALYDRLITCLHALAAGREWLAEYARFEYALLAEAGYRLDLERCADTGATENLTYISPKTGRAVCADSGAPYHDRLFVLPPFLRGEGGFSQKIPENAPIMPVSRAESLDALRVTGYFLHQWLLAPHGKALPDVRGRLLLQCARMQEPVRPSTEEIAAYGQKRLAPAGG